MELLGRHIALCMLGLALIAPAPALAGPPVLLTQFFEEFDDAPEAPPADDPALDGLDLDGQLDGGPNARTDPVPDPKADWPGGTADQGPGDPEQDVAGDATQRFDPAERPKLLEGLYERLSQAKSSSEAAPITEAIEQLWGMSGSDTVDLLMSRATQFANDSDVDLSLAVLDAVIDIAPEEAEAWYLRAKVNVLAGNPERALTDLRRTLNLDAKHYRAIADLGLVLEQLGAKKEALKAYREALAINPYMEDAQEGVDALAREVEGQDI